MDFQLVDSGWSDLFDKALREDHSCIRVICPFIKERAARRLVQYGQPEKMQVITRFDLDGFLQGASDISALRMLLQAGAQIRGIRNLHAKTYLIGSRVIVASANLTEQALNRNHEFGFTANNPEIAASCDEYFEKLWRRAGANLNVSKLSGWADRVAIALASGAGTRLFPKLGDEGANLGFAENTDTQPNWVGSATQGFVKFFGEGTNRLEHSFVVLDEVKRAGCHWACSYPKSKRPRSVLDGALMFMGRLASHPNDTLIFGRAIGMRHQEDRDNATVEDIEIRNWKVKWPRYIRVHGAEFVNGTLGDCVSLNELMDELGAHSFASTKRNLDSGHGNTNPRLAFQQAAQVELSPEATVWLNNRLEERFNRFGKISPEVMAALDWPRVPKFKN